MDNLKQQLLVSQFVSITGATEGEAGRLLREARWEFEVSIMGVFMTRLPAPGPPKGGP